MEQGDDNAGDGGAVSIGPEDQATERAMEQAQRREDERRPANDDEPTDRTTRADAGTDGGPDSTEAGPADDDADHPGQTPDGGLGGAGPVQP